MLAVLYSTSRCHIADLAMADDKHAAEGAQAGEGEEHEQSNYQKPKPKPLTEIMNTDAEDESLRKYKESLGLITANSKDLEVC